MTQQIEQTIVCVDIDGSFEILDVPKGERIILFFEPSEDNSSDTPSYVRLCRPIAENDKASGVKTLKLFRRTGDSWKDHQETFYAEMLTLEVPAGFMLAYDFTPNDPMSMAFEEGTLYANLPD